MRLLLTRVVFLLLLFVFRSLNRSLCPIDENVLSVAKSPMLFTDVANDIGYDVGAGDRYIPAVSLVSDIVVFKILRSENQAGAQKDGNRDASPGLPHPLIPE